ncbi:MAG: sulfatase [Verrucomicrobiae bacterium]|nr:sulfatase [Verrucomicrobiae bacterium]
MRTIPALFASLCVLCAHSAAETKPNVLFVVSDDLDCRIGCYGDRVAKTPNLDRLAARGGRVDRAYCQFPLCNPTRASVLSGRYPTSTGVLDNDTWLLIEPGQQTLPEFFAAHGYAVEQIGKIHHARNQGFRPGEPKPEIKAKGKSLPWFTPEERAQQQAEDPEYWDKHHSPYRNLVCKNPAQYAWANEFGPLPADDRGPDALFADKAIASMRSRAADGKPFFLAVGFLKPHVPLKAPRQFFDLYDPAAMPLPPDFDTEPRVIPGVPRDEFRQNLDLFTSRSFSVTEAREAMRAYYACTSYMDAQLGRLLDELEKLGLGKNTIVVVWGDHGWHLSEKGMWAKGTLFEVSARGPLIISDPRRKSAGRASRRTVQYLDLYPTLADLCGLPQPKHLEGASLRPLLDNPDAPWDRPAYTVQVRGWFLGRSVRTERWRYTEWDEGRRGVALYDHDNDPHEMRNLAADAKHADTLARLRKFLREGPVSTHIGTPKTQ